LDLLQIWNEPDIQLAPGAPDQWWGGCWGDGNLPFFGGEEYGSMLNAIAFSIRNFDPTAKIIIGGLLLDCEPPCSSSKFLEGILNTALPGSYDGSHFMHLIIIGKQGNSRAWAGSSWDQRSFDRQKAGSSRCLGK
jgi:hypothetical protein